MKMNKKLIHAATGVFLATEVLVIVLYTFAFGRGFNLNWSISRYMGTDYWSAILFALSNFLVVFLVLKYLLQVRKVHKLSLFWLVLVIAMVVAYVGLSICPIGLFDPSWGHFGIVSTLHHTFSQTLFAIMAMVALGTMLVIKRGKIFIAFGIALIVYMVGSTYCYKASIGFFIDNVLIFESAYILANLVFYSLIPKKSGIIEKQD